MRKTLFFIALFLSSSLFSHAGEYPYITVTMNYTTADGTTQDGATSVEGSAPIEATFCFTTTDAEKWTMTYEWRFAHQEGSLEEPYMIRYEESPTVTFTQAGTDSVALYAVFTREGYPTQEFKAAYWHGAEGTPLLVHATESKLTFPNAFSPNGDGINDYFKPKEYTSIVEFKAIIFNRWGQKIYEWNDVAGEGWDGTFNGHDVKQGTYFILCTAKGADGTTFEVKKDVNLLRGYDSTADTSSTGSESVTQ